MKRDTSDDVTVYIYEAIDHGACAIISSLNFFGVKDDYVLGWVMVWLVQFLSINSASQGVFISLLNKGRSDRLEKIFTHQRKLSPTFRMLYIKDFRICEDESLSQGWK